MASLLLSLYLKLFIQSQAAVGHEDSQRSTSPSKKPVKEVYTRGLQEKTEGPRATC